MIAPVSVPGVDRVAVAALPQLRVAATKVAMTVSATHTPVVNAAAIAALPNSVVMRHSPAPVANERTQHQRHN